MDNVLGIDVGGTNVKFGVVNAQGELSDKIKYPTATLTSQGGFIKEFADAIGEQLDVHKTLNIDHVGIGCPGLISKDRQTMVKLQNIPQLNGVNVIDYLSKAHPGVNFRLENDAKVAALGESMFGSHGKQNFLMITLGTGVGGACIIDGKLFAGVNGNGLEIGHMISSTGHVIEHHVGKKGIVRNALKFLDKYDDLDSVLRNIPADQLDSKMVEKAAKKGDQVARKVYKKMGKYVGQCIVSSLRVLDVDTVVIGGGVADLLKYMKKSMESEIADYLGDYYVDDLTIIPASLENEAGIIGAASLCFD